MDAEIKETLQKQLQLLSERSEEPGADLPALTYAMIEIVRYMDSSLAFTSLDK
ncbi:hypothetical protein [Clostridium sp. KNHs216]|uniref:hypothetical protein n=1 Tax=Clostridium sp. KNHs216 TaxID=1550235 RepID=UPI00116C1FD1|nr:hypothetical protein [Clostridium sp. KNHs216]TQI66228.1 hypothetical protein LY85_0889 [Clostridium sp. KNHs216]